MITRVSLKNWKSHEETNLEFSEGTNVLVGIMGSGKSAVLEAITYGLFGTTSGVRSRSIVLDDLIRNRPVKEDSAEVELEFMTSSGEKYVVRRVLEREKGTTHAELRRSDGDLIDKPNSTSVTEHITSLLQLDYDFFERMIYAKQNNLDRFLTLEPRERRKKIDELLKINKFEKARKNITTLINRLKNRTDDRRSDLRELEEDEDIKSLPSLEEELKETKSEKEELTEKKNQIEPQIEDVDKKLEKFKETKKKIEDLSRKYESIKGKIETLDDQISKVKEKLGGEIEVSLEDLKGEKSGLEEKLEKSKKKASDLESKSDSITSEVSRLKTEIKSLKNRISDLKKQIKDKEEKKEKLEEIDLAGLSDELEELQKGREELRDKFSNVKVFSKNLEDSLEELKEAESSCPVCERPLTQGMKENLIQERKKKLEESKSEISDLKKEIESLKSEMRKKKELREKARDLEKDVRDLPDLRSELSDSKEDLESKSEKLEEAEKSREKIKESLKKARRDFDKIQKEYESVKKKIDLRLDLDSSKEDRKKAEKKKKKIQKRLQEEKDEFDEKLVEELESKHQDLIKKQERFKTKLDEIEKLIDQKEKLVKTVHKKKKKLEHLEVEVEILEGSISSLSKVKKALSKSQVSLRKQVMGAVNDMMNDIWDDIYPYDDFSKIRLSIEEKGKISDYELQMKDSSGSWNSVEGVTSGGERTCASLTLRIAFAVVLAPNLSWLVLDEPTQNLDTEGISNLSEILRERIPRVVDQTLLITHERELESAVSGNLYRFHRDKSRDGPTEAERVSGEV